MEKKSWFIILVTIFLTLWQKEMKSYFITILTEFRATHTHIDVRILKKFSFGYCKVHSQQSLGKTKEKWKSNLDTIRGFWPQTWVNVTYTCKLSLLHEMFLATCKKPAQRTCLGDSCSTNWTSRFFRFSFKSLPESQYGNSKKIQHEEKKILPYAKEFVV